MKNLKLRIVLSVILTGLLIFLATLMRNEDDDFDPEVEWKYMLIDTTKTINENSSVNTNIKSEVNKEINSGGGNNNPESKIIDHTPEVNSYFKKITLGNEFGESRSSQYKWKINMKIYVEGEKKDYLMTELNKIVSELNDIITPIEIIIVSNKSNANYIIYLGNHKDFGKNYNLSYPERLTNNYGYFEVYNGNGTMYVDLYRTTNINAHKHLLREELTQSLGLFNDTYDYPESIFYQGWTTTTEFAPIDIELIEMLYNE